YLGLRTKICAIAFDRRGLEDNRWRVVWTMLGRAFIFQNALSQTSFHFDDQRLLVKLPLSRNVRNAALLTAHNPDRFRASHVVFSVFAWIPAVAQRGPFNPAA